MLPAHVFGSAESSLQRTLADEGLDAIKDRILPAALPALMLVPQRAAPKTFASQLGGDPWLPIDTGASGGAWPSAEVASGKGSKDRAAKGADGKKKSKKDGPSEADGSPRVAFGLVAQIPIRDLPRIPGLEFPVRGTFWFYFNERAPTLGTTVHSEVLPADLAPRPRPDGAPGFAARAVRYEPILTLPPPGTRAHARLKLRGPELDKYERAVEKNCAAHSGVQLFGHPSGALDGDLFEPLGGKDGDYTLLLSIDGKGELGWNKAGTLYYVIRRDDLAKGRLERTHVRVMR
jgi:hypothetical protein